MKVTTYGSLEVNFDGKDQSEFDVIAQLWEEYIGPREISWSSNKPYMQRMLMLQDSIRRCMRAEYESYLNGKATEGRVAQTKGHAVLLGKILAHNLRREPMPLA